MSDVVDISLCLRFQEQIVADLVKDDAILVLGRGLGMIEIVSNLIHVLTHISSLKQGKQGLIIVLNANPSEVNYIGEELLELNHFKNTNTFKVFNAESTSIDKRRQMYYEGGVICVSNRIFVADLLNKCIDANVITGLIMLHADQISEFSTHRFIIQLYRKYNKWGFLKTITDDPERLSSGSQPLRDNLRFSLLEKAFIWPRFHRDVKSSIKMSNRLLGADGNKVIEIRVEMTPLMEKIQNGLMSSIEQLLNELRRNVNKYSEDNWNLENSLNRNFISGIRNSLFKQWHRISESAKKLIDEISMILTILKALFIEDSITFNQRIQEYFKSIRDNPFDKSFWQLTDHFGTVLTCSQSRVRTKDPISQRIINVYEESPKWDQLGVILNEIEATEEKGPIVIGCNDYSMVHQLRNVITKMKTIKDSQTGDLIGFSHKKFMDSMRFMSNENKLERDISKIINQNIDKEEHLKRENEDGGNNEDEIIVSRTFTGRGKHNSMRRRTRGGAIMGDHDRLLNRKTDGFALDDEFSQNGNEIIELDDYESNDNEFEDPHVSNYSVIDKSNEIIIATFEDLKLDEILPSFIILYQPNLTFIRKVEVYQSSIKQSKCYFICYSASSEEQIYLNDVKFERDSIIKLIKEKAHMPKYFFEPDDEIAKYRHHEKAINTRIGGGGKQIGFKKNVIVDIRELRAKLPFILYLNELNIIPVQLTVGDYIISDEVCIERKSIPDLKSSLEKGRLFEQCLKMFQYYKTPIILIEFDNSTSFSFEQIKVGFYLENSGKPQNDLQIKKIQRDLMTLIKEFPKLRIIWASSPQESAKIIRSIKQKMEEPNLEDSINAGTLEYSGNVTFNEDSINMLKMIPGINELNYKQVMAKVNSISELSQLLEDELIKIIGEINGKLIFKFFNEELI